MAYDVVEEVGVAEAGVDQVDVGAEGEAGVGVPEPHLATCLTFLPAVVLEGENNNDAHVWRKLWKDTHGNPARARRAQECRDRGCARSSRSAGDRGEDEPAVGLLPRRPGQPSAMPAISACRAGRGADFGDADTLVGELEVAA